MRNPIFFLLILCSVFVKRKPGVCHSFMKNKNKCCWKLSMTILQRKGARKQRDILNSWNHYICTWAGRKWQWFPLVFLKQPSALFCACFLFFPPKRMLWSTLWNSLLDFPVYHGHLKKVEQSRLVSAPMGILPFTSIEAGSYTTSLS